jgi:hypothetical protein
MNPSPLAWGAIAGYGADGRIGDESGAFRGGSGLECVRYLNIEAYGLFWSGGGLVGELQCGVEVGYLPISLRSALSGGPFRAENGGWLSADVVSP